MEPLKAKAEVPRLVALVLPLLIVIATGLRLHRLGTWPLEGDELFTWRDSQSPAGWRNSRPLLYLLNYVLIRPWKPLDELGLRLLPVLFGVVAVPVMYLVVRRLLGPRAGAFAALLLTFSPVHVLQSQNARYWSLVFLLSTVYPVAIFLGLRERRPLYLAAGLIGAILATLAHPSASLLLGALLVWYFLTAGLRDRWKSLATRRRWEAVAALAVVALVGSLLLPMLRNWVTTPRLVRLRGLPLLLSHVDSLSATLVLLALAGIWWLWRSGGRDLALLLACLISVSPLLLLALSYVAAVATSYLFATAPAIFIGAAAFLDRLASSPLPQAERRLTVATFLLIVLAGNVPLLASQYLDGGRPDFRRAAQFLAPRLGPADVVISDESRLLAHYLGGRAVVLSLPRSADEFTDIVGRREAPTLWIVALTSSRGGFKAHKLGLGALAGWIHGHCQLVEQIGVARLDFRQNELQLYRCPPTPSPTS